MPKGSRGQHRRKRGKLREFGANASDKRQADRDLQKQLALVRTLRKAHRSHGSHRWRGSDGEQKPKLKRSSH